ncbi:hypothetical protein JCM11251_002416 [Rhodosporidiobolus azoricus]
MDYSSRLPRGASNVAESPLGPPRRSRSGTVSAARPLEAVDAGETRGGTLNPGAVAEEVEAWGPADERGGNGRNGDQEQQLSMDGLQEKRAVGPQALMGNSLAGGTFGRGEEQRQEAYQALAYRPPQREGPTQVAGQGRKRLKKWLVLVVPPDILPHSPPPLEASAFANGYGASGRYSGGILLPLQPTLSAQVSLVAREFALPSIAGVSLYLCLPDGLPPPAPLPYGQHGYPFPAAAPPPTQSSAGLKPRLTDEAWMACFADFFDPEARVAAMAGVGLLPIAARIEVDIDPRRARWLPAWTALPSVSLDGVQSTTPRSPAFANRTPGQPRFGTSLSYNRPFTPSSASEGHLSELQTTDEEGENAVSETEEAPQLARQRWTPSAGPQTSTAFNSFSTAPRPLSVLSAQSSVTRSQPSSPRCDSFSRSSSPLRLPDEPEPVSHSLEQQQQAVVGSAALEDSGFAEEWKGEKDKEEGQHRCMDEQDEVADLSSTPTQRIVPPGAVEPVTIEDDGQVFAFPRPPTPLLLSSAPAEQEQKGASAADESVDAEQQERSTEDWTAQLDRLREVSRTALVEGVEHPSAFGSFDATASYRELLRDIGQEDFDEGEQPTSLVEEHSSFGFQSSRGLRQQIQPDTVLPPPLLPPTSTLSTVNADFPPNPPAPALSPSAPGYPYNLACLYPSVNHSVFDLLRLIPIIPVPPRHLYDLSPTLASPYPNLQLYPPVYPNIDIYPSYPAQVTLTLSLSGSLRRSQRPPHLPLSQVEVAYHANCDSWPPTPPSPERQLSATLEDRLCHSGTGEFATPERNLSEDDSLKKAVSTQDDVRAAAFDRRGNLIETDWDMRRNGMRSLQEASQPSPVQEDVEDTSEDEFPVQRRQSTASLTLVEDDPFKPGETRSGEWTSDSEDAGGDSSDEDEILASYGDGRPLSAILEEVEMDSTAVSVAEAGPSDNRGFYGGLVGGTSSEEDDQSPERDAVEPQGWPQLPAMSLHTPFDPPRIVYSAATASPATPSSRYSDEAYPASSSPPLRSPHSSYSPLPSPTITPSRQYGAVSDSDSRVSSRSPASQLEEEQEEADECAPALLATSARSQYSNSTTPDEDDYTLEIDDTHTSSYDGSYLLSPGLQRALGLDDSPELAPVNFAADDELEISDDGSEGSQYVVREEESCQTFDHLSPLPSPPVPEPVLFVFPPTDQSSDMIDAIAQFVCEAQTQSVERRGKFVVALSGYPPLPELLSQALVSDERIEFDKWEIFFTEENLTASAPPPVADASLGGASHSTLGAYTSFLSRIPIPSDRVHVPRKFLINSPQSPDREGGEQAPSDLHSHTAEKVAREYEAQLRRAFGVEESAEVPRFDLVLLGIGQDGSCAGIFPHSELVEDAHSHHYPPSALVAPVVDSSTSSLTFTLPLLSSARRLAFLCACPPHVPPSLPSPAYPAVLANMLDASIAQKVPAGRVRLGGGQPVIVFADEGAAKDVPLGEGRRMNFWEGVDEEDEARDGEMVFGG